MENVNIIEQDLENVEKNVKSKLHGIIRSVNGYIKIFIWYFFFVVAKERLKIDYDIINCFYFRLID